MRNQVHLVRKQVKRGDTGTTTVTMGSHRPSLGPRLSHFNMFTNSCAIQGIATYIILSGKVLIFTKINIQFKTPTCSHIFMSKIRPKDLKLIKGMLVKDNL